MNFTSRYDETAGCEVYTFQHVINCSVRQSDKITKDTGVVVADNKETQAPESAEDEDIVVPEQAVIGTNNSSIVPNDGTVRQTWRLISGVKAWPHSGFEYPQLVDYSYEGGQFLKDAIDIINTQKPDLLWNHSLDAHDVAGHIENARWEDPTSIPGGINADLVVDPMFDAKAVLGLQKGYIRNGSIGVNVECRPSHSGMKLNEFVKVQGDMVDGNEVRWLPVKLYDVRHMALVPAGTGADPFAGTREVLNTKQEPSEEKEQIVETENVVEIQGEVMEDEKTTLLATLAQSLGVEVALSEEGALPEGLADRLTKKIEKLSAVTDKYNSLVNKVEQISEKLGVEFKDTFDVMSDKIELAKHGEKLLEHYRKDATKWFDAAKAAQGRTELNESEKRMKTRISQSDDLDYLEDICAEYRTITETSLSSERVSQGQDITVSSKVVAEDNIEARDIAASASRLFGNK